MASENATNSRQLKGLKFKTQKALDGEGKDSLITEGEDGKTIVNLGTSKELFSEGKDGEELTIKEGKITNGEGKEKYVTTDTNQEIVSEDQIITKRFYGRTKRDFVHLSYGRDEHNVPHFGVQQGDYYVSFYWPFIDRREGTLYYPNKGGTFALTSDIPAIYRHTILMVLGTSKIDSAISFTVYTKDSQVIDSIQDLCTKLANTDIQASGYTPGGFPLYIHVGTSATDTKLIRYQGGDDQPAEPTLASLGFQSIMDSVTTLVAPIATANATAKENLFPEEEEDEPESEEKKE